MAVPCDVFVKPEGIEIKPRGWHRFGSMSRGFTIPADAVRAVNVRRSGIRDEWKKFQFTKMKAGSFIPGVYKAGMFRPWGKAEDSDTTWWLVGKPDQTIELVLRGFKYDRVIVEVDDPDGIAAHIRAVIGGGKPA